MAHSALTEDQEGAARRDEPAPAGGKAMRVYLGFWASALVLVTAIYAYLASSRGEALSDTGFWGTVLPLIELGIVGFIYLLPAFTADRRRHRDLRAIAIVNVLVGWTIIGWVVALVWALSPARGLKAVAPGRERQ